MCVFQESLLLINSPRNFVSLRYTYLFIIIFDLYGKDACTFISKLKEIIFVKI